MSCGYYHKGLVATNALGHKMLYVERQMIAAYSEQGLQKVQPYFIHV